MTGDEYVQSIITKYRTPTGPNSAAARAATWAAAHASAWAGQFLRENVLAGSYAKGTAIHGVTDVDLFVSLKEDTPGTLAELYNGLFDFLHANGLTPRKQDVSIGLEHDDMKIDVVPGRKQRGNTDHSLYRRKANTWVQTNIDIHVTTVVSSGRVNEISALKIWAIEHELDFCSFYLELSVIESLRQSATPSVATNVLTALRYFATRLPTARVVDPANSNNVVSDTLTRPEKVRIADLAAVSAAQPMWGSIIW